MSRGGVTTAPARERTQAGSSAWARPKRTKRIVAPSLDGSSSDSLGAACTVASSRQRAS